MADFTPSPVAFERPTAGRKREAPSFHELINQSVADLRVLCLGVEDGCLYFERLPGANRDRDAVANEIIQRLLRLHGPIREALQQSISKIAVR
jgi:hypothetical protein